MLGGFGRGRCRAIAEQEQVRDQERAGVGQGLEAVQRKDRVGAGQGQARAGQGQAGTGQGQAGAGQGQAGTGQGQAGAGQGLEAVQGSTGRNRARTGSSAEEVTEQGQSRAGAGQGQGPGQGQGQGQAPGSQRRQGCQGPRGRGGSCRPGCGAQRHLWHYSTPHAPLPASAATSAPPCPPAALMLAPVVQQSQLLTMCSPQQSGKSYASQC